MAQHNDLGKQGEKIALLYLQEKDYQILSSNYTFKKAEIDIIALCPKKEFIVFVEVKTRNSSYFGEPHLAVKTKKRGNIIAAAHQFIIENDYDNEARFDIISIVLNKTTQDIEHIESAFWAVPK
ncbi:MAG: YraN family protein [Luteibaculaceae bacterium]